MEKDYKLTFPIILTITLIFLGIATLFYVRYLNKEKMVKRENIERQMGENQERLKENNLRDILLNCENCKG